MNRRLFVLLPAAFAVLLSPLSAYAANLPLLSPGWAIVPTACQACPCGFAGVLQTVQNLMNAGVSASVVIAVIMITYAGALFILNPTNPENKTAGKKALENAVIGMIIVLAAWVIVDFIMKIFYGGQFGPWNNILTGGDTCVQVSITQPLFTGNTMVTPGVPGSYGTGAGDSSGSTGNGTVGTGDCSPDAVVRYGINSSIANPMSCIAMAESGCNSNADAGKLGTTAHGIFQVVMGYDDTGHNLNFPICSQAAQSAGYNIQGNLNCSKAFSGGTVRSGMETLAAACRAASSNNTCNGNAAQWLYSNRGGFSQWATHAKCGV